MSILVNQQLAEILQEESNRFNQNQADAIASLTSFKSGDLQRDRSVTTNGNSISQTMKAYGRILDINQKRRKGGIDSKNINIHNKFAFGMYHAVAYRAANIYVANIKLAIKDNFSQN